jgi:hypothetical protein
MTNSAAIGAVKRLIKESPLYPLVRTATERLSARRALADWIAAGSSGPPPHPVKQGVVRTYARRFGLRTLVETGTYFGQMVDAVRPEFDRVHTVEVDEALFAAAQRRFARVPSVTLHRGDSAEVLPRVLEELTGPALFWLDGHFSGGVTSKGAKDTPIVEEVTAILKHAERRHVILVDDARCFGADRDYPSLEDFRALVHGLRPELHVEVEHDIIRITPPPAGVGP